jgi:hypothetical protein
MENPFRETQDIFDGKFKLVTEDNEFRMSHWVRGFGVTDSTTGNWILELETSFNLEKFELTDNILKVYFEVYPNRSAQYEAEINPFAQTFMYQSQTLQLTEFSSFFKSLTSNNS